MSVNPPRVTIGLPVYNGEDLIGECLRNIAEETYTDFVVRIFDNASTDRTGEIARSFAERDPRFIYHRNPENVGSAQNFLDALAAADTEYFLWRADDDLASANFLETAVGLLDAAPDAALAATHVRSERPGKNRVKESGYIADWPAPRVINILRRMFFSHPSWIYGLWRTDRLRHYYHNTWESYPVGWANDHLVLLHVILDEAVVGSNAATFTQRIGVRASSTPPTKVRQPLSTQIENKRTDLDRFRPLCRQAVADRAWSGAERFLLDLLIDRYAAKRVRSSEFRILKLKLRRALLGRA